jgi:hypothetical protein
LSNEQAEIGDEQWLLRRIAPGKWEHEQGRPQSGQFKNRRGDRGLSFYLEAEISADAVLAGHSGYGLVRIRAGQLREAGFSVVRVHDADDSLAERARAHVEAWFGGEPGRNVPGTVALHLATVAAQNTIIIPG